MCKFFYFYQRLYVAADFFGKISFALRSESVVFEESEQLPGLPEADCHGQMGNLCYDMEDLKKHLNGIMKLFLSGRKCWGFLFRKMRCYTCVLQEI